MKVSQPLAPPGKFECSDVYSRCQWRRVQALAEKLWSRWKHEYLFTIQKRQKWTTTQRNLALGDVVLLKDDDAVRTIWKLGRIVAADPGRDGLVQSFPPDS